MIVIGSGGHAREVLQILHEQNKTNNLFFFDDISNFSQSLLYHQFPIIRTYTDLQKAFLQDPKFVLGIGGCDTRHNLAEQAKALGGTLCSIISKDAQIGTFEVKLGLGLNVMKRVFISNDVKIGEGCLLNYDCSIHHEVHIGSYCELSPRCQILGKVRIGDHTSIGAGAVILPKIQIGSNVSIGAGAIVTKDIPDNVIAKGNPARYT